MQQGNSTTATGATANLTDEQILGLETDGAAGSRSAVAQVVPDDVGRGDLRNFARSDAADEHGLGSPDGQRREDPSYNGDAASGDGAAEPAWLKALEAQPEAAAEARRWRQAAMDAAALDADYFSAAPGARARLAARLHTDDPAAFRAMLADAARVLAERDPQGLAELARQLGNVGPAAADGAAKSIARAARNRRDDPSYNHAQTTGNDAAAQVSPSRLERDREPEAFPVSPGASAFPAETYRAFETAINDDVARQVRDSIDRTLAATLPDGMAGGARRRIGEDIFRDLSAALSTDRELSGQIGQMLRGSPAEDSPQAGWRFDAATRQQLAGLLSGRARKALPEVARRVISEWTSSVLASDRIKQTRIASAVSRRDITGGRLPEPVASSALYPRRVDYARTSDEQILEM